MSIPKISVIIPVYNCEKYLERCINSIISQSFRDIEILLIDDGSTDSSGKICDNYFSKDSRIKIFHKNNEGPAVARNTGINNSIGEFIYFCDSDDTLTENALEILYTWSSQNKADVVFANCNIMQLNGEIDYHKSIKKNEILNKKEFLDYVTSNISALCFITVWNTLYNRKCIGDTRFISEFIVGQDLPFNLEIYKKVNKAVLLEDPLYNYYETPGAISRNFTAKKIYLWMKQNVLLIDFYKSTDSQKNIIYAKKNIHNKIFNCYRNLLKQGNMDEYKKATLLDYREIDFEIILANGFHPKEIIVLILIKFRLFTLLRLLKPLL